MENSPVTLAKLRQFRATYSPGEPATIAVSLNNADLCSYTVRMTVALSWLDQIVEERHQEIELPAGTTCVTQTFTLPRASFRGYGVDITVRDEHGHVLRRASTALDVLDDWTQAPRYGFLSNFSPATPDAPKSEESIGETVATLASDYHINVAQFYDWMWRHYILMPPTDTFVDACNRTLSLAVTRTHVKACHDHGIAALGYAAVYGAEPEYALEHPEEMLYDAHGEPYSLEKAFYIMNIHRDNPWRKLILEEMARAVREVPFDGLHLDQYGFPKEHVFGPAPEHVPYNLAADFPSFIDAARTAIRETCPESRVIFNAVTNWPIETVAPSSQDATYIEVWAPYDSYLDLQQLILNARRLAPSKQVILAAYLNL